MSDPSRELELYEQRESDLLEQAQALVEQKPELVLPLSGEVVDLREPAQVAHGLEAIREARQQLNELRALLEALLRLESQRQGTKTLHLEDGRTAVLSGGTRVVYDAEQLAHELERAGLPPERLAEIVRPVIEYRVDARLVKQLEAANPAYAEAIARNRRTEEAPWRVAVKSRARGER